ncbi:MULTISPECIES: TetR/AcrR family transcriptional regulator [Actinosynnema]|uniref:TetR family transcriptional regulator n=1 Tax=Actinosynnema pretiosum TaxID=42197 RepID=A0A290Z8D8_9PSEU|nr:TetR/AcrR family transcriptional regulator [Actinosynnema pretiosum]ATE55242.1 TetR family transcriptional regulator [Actinosynnema pretiosum]
MGEGLRDRKKRLTRQALADAALDLVTERGLDGITVEDIAAAAGVSARTFFNYFTTKEEALLGPDPDAGPRLARRILDQPADLAPLAVLRAALLAELAEETAGRDEWLRRMRVIEQNPVLLPKVLAAGEQVERHMVRALAERTGHAETDAHPMLLAASANTAFRVAAWRWASWPGAGDAPQLTDLIAEAFDLLACGFALPSPPHHRSDEER